MTQFMVRQGDILIKRVEKIPSGLKKVRGRKVLAEGEVTGHVHEVVGEAELFRAEDIAEMEQSFLRVESAPIPPSSARSASSNCPAASSRLAVGVPPASCWLSLNVDTGSDDDDKAPAATLAPRSSVRPRGWGSHRLHRDDGPAVVWPDGWGVYAVHGVRVPAHVIERPETITVERIQREENLEVRRVMMERYGHDRFLRDGDSKLIQHDDCGKLWRTEIAGDEPLVMVEVVNSTAEPDGTFKTYFLRVPPDVRTAREAVAWTFDVPAKGYELERQT